MEKLTLIHEPGATGGVTYDDRTLAIESVFLSVTHGKLTVHLNGRKFTSGVGERTFRVSETAILKVKDYIVDDETGEAHRVFDGKLQTSWQSRS